MANESKPNNLVQTIQRVSSILEELGKKFKVTRERIRQIEIRALKKLQHPVRSRVLEGFLE